MDAGDESNPVRDMRLTLGRPRGVWAWATALAAIVAFIGSPRGSVLPFFGLFGDAPLGMGKLGWLLVGCAMFAAHAVVQFSRGDVESIDDDPPTTLDLENK